VLSTSGISQDIKNTFWLSSVFICSNVESFGNLLKGMLIRMRGISSLVGSL